MVVKQNVEAQNPLILRCNRLMEAFAKSDDERDFYLDRTEGFLVYVDLDKPDEDLHILEKELEKNQDRYCMIPKLTFYETKKIMEGFVNEKVYDIDTKEKLLDIIQSKEARENFLEFIYDHHSELEKWQTFYQERSRIRIIEWLRVNHFNFVFEEDLDLPKLTIEKLKKELFQIKAGKDVLNARKVLSAKAKTYYSNEALNPRPKRGRPPKQIQKTEVEPQVTTDIYTTVPPVIIGFLFIPDLTGPSSATFSSKFGNEEDLYTNRRPLTEPDVSVESLNQKLAALKTLSNKWKDPESKTSANASNFDEDDEDDGEEEDVKPVLNGHSLAKKRSPSPTPKSEGSISPAKNISKPKPKPLKAQTEDKKSKPKLKPKAAEIASDSKKPKALRPMMKLKKKAKP